VAEVIAILATLGDRPEMLAQTVAAWAGVAGVELRVMAAREPMGVQVDRAYRDVGDDEIAVQVCDDTVPLFTDMNVALEMYLRKEQPAPRFLTANGEPWSSDDSRPDGAHANWTRFPMASGRVYRELGPMLPTTSFIDFDYSERFSIAGWKIKLCHAFSFTHLDGPHTWQDPELDAREADVYRAAQVARGQA
jgi:hypothetical protein